MIWVTAAWAGAIAVGDGGIAVASGGTLAVVDPATGQPRWALPTGGVRVDGLGWAGERLWAFGEQGAWAFAGGRLVEVHGDVIDGALPTRIVPVGERLWVETPDQVVVIEAGRVVSRGPAAHLGPEGRTSDRGWPVARGELGSDMVLRSGSKVLATLPGDTLLAEGPAGYVCGPEPTFVSAEGAIRAQFDPAEAFAVTSDTIYSARDGELRAFSLDGKTRWRLTLQATPPTLGGLVVVGQRSTLSLDPVSGALLGGWIGAVEAEAEAVSPKGRAVATLSGSRLSSTDMVGKGRRRKPAWVVEVAAGERPVDLRGPVLLASSTRWRVIDARNGRELGAGPGVIKTRLSGGWMVTQDGDKVSLVKLSTGEVQTFSGAPEVVGVLADGRVVLLDTAIRVIGGAGWTAVAPDHAAVAGDLVLGQVDGILYALREGQLVWAVPFTEELRGTR